MSRPGGEEKRLIFEEKRLISALPFRICVSPSKARAFLRQAPSTRIAARVSACLCLRVGPAGEDGGAAGLGVRRLALQVRNEETLPFLALLQPFCHKD